MNHFPGSSVTCPKCGENGLHPVLVKCLPAGALDAEVSIDASGLTVAKGIEPVGRGVLITIGFVGECGHGSLLEYHFHKGATFVSHESVPGASDWPDTIWRD